MAEKDGKTEKDAFSVSELHACVRTLLAPLGRRFVVGELSRWQVYPSGHAYFTLKDEKGAILPGVMFAASLARCAAAPRLKVGTAVVLFGTLDVYGPNGGYQFKALAAKIAGEGDLAAKFEELKRKLTAEGLFEDSRKVPLPALPHRIGIVTSAAGAVIHDMCRVITRRFPNLEILLYPVKVQGQGASAEIAAALRWMDARGMDVVIVGRGGGSPEDLWAFNEEETVRAVAAMKTPVVSAVGHQTDFTLCDFAADVRAGTPSIAGELVAPEKDALRRRLDDLAARLRRVPQQAYETAAQRTDRVTERLAAALKDALAREETRLVRLQGRLAPLLSAAVAAAQTRLACTQGRLAPAAERLLATAERRLAALTAKLPLLDPENPLKRGYAIAFDAQGNVIRKADAVAPGAALRIRLGEGELAATAATAGA